jgi:signal transduction histidine kinase/CheY-like chemotaxis protein
MARILVVEDEIAIALVLKETLEELGHTVVDLVVSGIEAIRASLNHNPDLILMDIQLAGEMDGIAAGNEIYHQSEIPIVYLTGHDDELTIEQAIQTSPFGYIIKPFETKALQSTIQVALQRQIVQRQLWKRNQALEEFQLKLISRLQWQNVQYQTSIACNQLLDRVLKKFHTARSEYEILQIAIDQLVTGLDADYAWIALHDRHQPIARIFCESSNHERQIVNPSAIGQEIELQLYPRFYRHLLQLESWIDPPEEIVPSPYLNLVLPAAVLLICPIVVHQDHSEGRNDWTMGEVGIVTTGKPEWESSQASLITQILSYCVKLFRQNHLKSLDPPSISLSLEWLNSLKDNFTQAIAQVERDLKTSADLLQQQIRSLDVTTDAVEVIHHHHLLHRQLLPHLRILRAEWQRQLKLIDTLIDVQTGGVLSQHQTWTDIQFQAWIERTIASCADLTEQYQQQLSYHLTENLPPTILCHFPILELAILEMFGSACKYTPPYQSIVVRVEVTDNQLTVSVVSREIEIPSEELATIFQPFAPNSPDRACLPSVTGLGLALVKRLVPHLGGEIEAKSDRGVTSLILTIPQG